MPQTHGTGYPSPLASIQGALPRSSAADSLCMSFESPCVNSGCISELRRHRFIAHEFRPVLHQSRLHLFGSHAADSLHTISESYFRNWWSVVVLPVEMFTRTDPRGFVAGRVPCGASSWQKAADSCTSTSHTCRIQNLSCPVVVRVNGTAAAGNGSNLSSGGASPTGPPTSTTTPAQVHHQRDFPPSLQHPPLQAFTRYDSCKSVYSSDSQGAEICMQTGQELIFKLRQCSVSCILFRFGHARGHEIQSEASVTLFFQGEPGNQTIVVQNVTVVNITVRPQIHICVLVIES